MGFIKRVFRFLFSRRLWTIIGLVLLCLAIWFYGPLLSFGETVPLASELARIVVIGLIVILWLFSVLMGQLRAARANQAFVTELAKPEPERPALPGEENVAEVNEKFAGILDEMKRSKLGKKKFLRDMPWYIFIGPPGTGKTTALQQSGLHFPIDLSDDIKGVGGTRNCDWFFAEDAVLIDTAGRYAQQESQAEVDAAEWTGFLELLKKHRGRRALNGVILTLSVLELMAGEDAIRAEGRKLRKRLSELQEHLGIRLPVYLLITKMDLLPGFEAMFGGLNTREREQVWGATFDPDARLDGVSLDREMRALFTRLEEAVIPQLSDAETADAQVEAFRFPAQVEALTQPMRILIDTVFGDSRYEESAWLRGFYLTSATQEGSPVDRLVGELAGAFGIHTPPPAQARRGEKRSFFLHDLITEVIFPEAGLGTFDRNAEERRKWIWRGSLAGAALTIALGVLFFSLSYLGNSAAIGDQQAQLQALQGRLANVAARPAPLDPPDLYLALDAVTEVAAVEAPDADSWSTVTGPGAGSELDRSQQIALERTYRNILEPRMMALLEATMWRQIRDPEYLLGALKVYQMMTGLAPVELEFAQDWWLEELLEHAPINPFPTESAALHQLAALERIALDPDKFEADQRLVSEAVRSICTIPLSVRAYNTLLATPQVAELADWIPAEHAGPNGNQVLTRLSLDTLRVGIDGAFTYDGFHQVVLPLIPEIAAEAALDRAVFSGGCAESASSSIEQLEADIQKLYQEDFIAQWDGFLRDVRLAPITDLRVGAENLKDLSSADSTLHRLLRAVVKETNLTFVPPEDEGGGGGGGKLVNKALGKLGKLGKIAKKSKKLVAGRADGAAAALPGAAVAEHFKALRGTVEEVDGVPPKLDDAVLALKALANELQTVLASPDPEAALLARGGLGQLTGAVAAQAQILPDPVDDWLAAIAGDAMTVTRDAVIAQLNARWRADVLPFCTSATAGRYPFDQSSAIDVNASDFNRLFGPGQLMDNFINDQLLPYIDTARRPWAWRSDFGLDNGLLAPFERARSIRDALFPGGAGPIMAFTLEPTDLTPNASRVTLNLDGQQMTYFNSAVRPAPMTWPGPDKTNLITMAFAPIDGSPEVIATESGSWAWLRMIRKGNLSPTNLPELFKLRLGFSGFAVSMNLRAASVDNPFDLSMFGQFRCPQGF